MSDELSNATRIAALEADVVRLTAELQGERDDLDEISHSYGDALVEEAMLTRRIEELKDYNQRLLAENVRLTNEAAFMRSFINNEDVRSDFQTVTQMRQALGCERERVREWNVLVAQGCTPGGSEFHDCPQNVAYYIKERLADKDRIMKSQQKELNKERERCGVLEAEVKAWHAAEHLRKDEPHNEFMRLAEARARTRETHALDAAKFVGGG